eukprot:m.83956 g.83956  ORF g.83956 m.83956 type:complete len:528 (+) comp14781_c0_seq3:165-1748(+)
MSARRRVQLVEPLDTGASDDAAGNADDKDAGVNAEDTSMDGSADETSDTPADTEASEVLRSPSRRHLRKGSVVFVLPPVEGELPLLERPAHDVRDSLLHSKSGFDDFRGIYNLAVLALFVTGFRVALINFVKYGILIDPYALVALITDDHLRWPNLTLLMLLNIFVLVALAVEKLASKRLLSQTVAAVFHGTNCAVALIFPCVYILYTPGHPLPAALVLFQACIVWMKIISYVAVNQHYRKKYLDGEASKTDSDAEGEKYLTRYPKNLTLPNVYYFAFAPTLCYELNFPRTERIRRRFLLRRIFEAIFLLCLAGGLAQQWVSPTLNNTFKTQPESPASPVLRAAHFVERALKLALPNNMLWLLFFYLFFHDWLNICGELLRFGDRQFYRDWWNATTISYFWRNWNIPVHKWARRHLYSPMRAAGFSRMQAQLVVFLVSAIFHELLVSVPLGMFKFWSFLAMVVQVPLAIVNDRYLRGTAYGNIVVWASLFVGQPVAIMLYMNAYKESQAASAAVLAETAAAAAMGAA